MDEGRQGLLQGFEGLVLWLPGLNPSRILGCAMADKTSHRMAGHNVEHSHRGPSLLPSPLPMQPWRLQPWQVGHWWVPRTKHGTRKLGQLDDVTTHCFWDAPLERYKGQWKGADATTHQHGQSHGEATAQLPIHPNQPKSSPVCWWSTSSLVSYVSFRPGIRVSAPANLQIDLAHSGPSANLASLLLLFWVFSVSFCLKQDQKVISTFYFIFKKAP